MMADRAFNVLFLCTHNSARSIMAEVVLNYVGRGKFKGYSAGSQSAIARPPRTTHVHRMIEINAASLGGMRSRATSARDRASTNTASFRSPSPVALATLQRMHFPTDGLRSKDWSEFARPAAPVMDFVLTVCDNAAGEVCPVWPGQPITAHWGVEDPSQFQGNDEEKSREFARVAHILKRRIELFVSLPLEKLERLKLAERIKDIGKR